MPDQTRTMKELLEHIVRTQTAVVATYGDNDFPVVAPPASPQSIARAEARLGLTFPRSYREFLLQSNGVRHFAQEIDLFSVEDFETREYHTLVDEIRCLGWDLGDRILVEGVIIAGQPGFRSIFLIDMTVEPDAEAERAVVHWSDTELLRVRTFRDFLDKWCGVVDEELADAREKAREMPPGIPMARPRHG